MTISLQDMKMDIDDSEFLAIDTTQMSNTDSAEESEDIKPVVKTEMANTQECSTPVVKTETANTVEGGSHNMHSNVVDYTPPTQSSSLADPRSIQRNRLSEVSVGTRRSMRNAGSVTSYCEDIDDVVEISDESQGV